MADNQTKTGKVHPKNERSLFIIKPDGVQRGLVGEIITRFERKGLKIAALKLVVPTLEQAKSHYSGLDDAWCEKVGGYVKKAYDEQGLEFTYPSLMEAGKSVKNSLVEYLSCGPIVAIVLQGAHAVEHVRKMMGTTDPKNADIGTIRGDYTIESINLANSFDRTVRNVAHASESVSEAEREIKVWFTEDEVAKYNLAIDSILYDPKWDKLREELI